VPPTSCLKTSEYIRVKTNNILLVTADQTDIDDIREALVEHEVLTCTETNTAIRLCAENDIQQVIVEEGLPRRSGIELFVELRKYRPWICGLLLIDRADETVLRKALDAGMNGLLEKPVDPVKLLQRIYQTMEAAHLWVEHTRLGTLQPLYSFGEHFLSASTEQDVFDGLLDVVAEITNATRISIMWFREEEG